MEHEPEESPAGVEPAEDDDDDSRKAAGLIAGTTGAAAFGGTVVGGIAASGGTTEAAVTSGAAGGAAAAPSSPPVVVHGSPSAAPVHGSPSAPVHGSQPSTVHAPPAAQGPGIHGDPLGRSPGSTPIAPVTAVPPDDSTSAGRTDRWVMVVAGAIVAAAVVVGIVLFSGGDDDPTDNAGSPVQAEPAVTDPEVTKPGGSIGAPLTAPEVAGSTTLLGPLEGGAVTFVVTGGLEQSAEFLLRSTVPAEGGVLLNYANDAGDQVLQVGVLADRTIVSYTGGGAVVAGDSDLGCTFDLTYEGEVLVGGTFDCAGIPGVVNGSSPITADISGSFATGP